MNKTLELKITFSRTEYADLIGQLHILREAEKKDPDGSYEAILLIENLMKTLNDKSFHSISGVVFRMCDEYEINKLQSDVKKMYFSCSNGIEEAVHDFFELW